MNLLVYFLTFLAAFRTVSSIRCYVCNATDTSSPFQCGELFERYDTPDIEPQDCSDVHGAQYCVKHIGRFEGGIGAKRFCSSKDLGNYCNYVQNVGDRMEYRSCIFTCSTDGCNFASSLRSSHVFVAIGAICLALLV
ncbi:U-scoloptoxin(05)-Sm1a isoform X2 [Phlebotomus argentipes]|uniref:U-scoloptoxin(05)-Sm1a isoform X2 n=1 Tax=Phlebotomus argentipes TaxID=94469 RepID=UPI002892CDBA|nr:U-scoloptoxin(05)-Sm1a isoform X2 [Phlebotomus argentipes]